MNLQRMSFWWKVSDMTIRITCLFNHLVFATQHLSCGLYVLVDGTSFEAHVEILWKIMICTRNSYYHYNEWTNLHYCFLALKLSHQFLYRTRGVTLTIVLYAPTPTAVRCMIAQCMIYDYICTFAYKPLTYNNYSYLSLRPEPRLKQTPIAWPSRSHIYLEPDFKIPFMVCCSPFGLSFVLMNVCA